MDINRIRNLIINILKAKAIAVVRVAVYTAGYLESKNVSGVAWNGKS